VWAGQILKEIIRRARLLEGWYEDLAKVYVETGENFTSKVPGGQIPQVGSPKRSPIKVHVTGPFFWQASCQFLPNQKNREGSAHTKPILNTGEECAVFIMYLYLIFMDWQIRR